MIEWRLKELSVCFDKLWAGLSVKAEQIDAGQEVTSQRFLHFGLAAAGCDLVRTK